MSLIAADLNIRLSAGTGGCGPAAVNNAYPIYTTIGAPPPETVRWTNGPHAVAGHLLVTDGSVMFLNSIGLTRTLSTWNSTDAGVHHVLRAH